MKNIKDVCCPKCGAKHFEELFSTSTLAAVLNAKVWLDGELVEESTPRMNTVTTHFRCLECGEEFAEDNVIFVSDEIKAIPC